MSTSATPAMTPESPILHVGDCSSKHNNGGGRYDNMSKQYVTGLAGQQPKGTPFIEQKIGIGSGLFVRCISYANHLFVGPAGSEFPWSVWVDTVTPEGDGTLATIEVVGSATTKMVKRKYRWWGPMGRWGYTHYNNSHDKVVEQVDCYIPDNDRHHRHRHPNYNFDPASSERLPYIYVTVRVTAFDQTVEKELRFRIPRTGKVSIGGNGTPILTVDVDALGVTHQFTETFAANERNRNGVGPLGVLFRHLKHSEIEGGKDALWSAFLSQWCPDPTAVPMDGLASLYKRKAFKPAFDRLEAEEPLDFTFLRWLHGKDTDNGRKNNQLISAMFKEVAGDYDRLLDALRTARETAVQHTMDWESYGSGHILKGDGHPCKRAICLTLPGAAEKVLKQKQQKDFRLHTNLGKQADGLGVAKENYPKLRAAIEKGHISIKCFNQPGKDGQPVNREFALWEKSLKQKGWAEVIYKVCANAASRSTYERDITPWLNSLFTVPAYLDKHTPGRQKWKGFPKFVKSQWELEMGNDDAEDNGVEKTVKERSAFTPQVDNEARTVAVPYVAVCVSGVRTQWCYSKNYFVFEAGFTDPETGGIVVNDYEVNLNGQGDDYGLMYFTLNGTMTARGYPTFLIIFERREDKSTFVHFHRVRPCRSAYGVKTPACQLVERCYQYMAGNVPATEVTAQQGDLIFIKHGNDPIAAKAKVHPNPESGRAFEFESHRFVSDNPDVPLIMHRSAAKTPKNRMGFMHAPSGLSVRHPEHDDIVGLEEGWYEVRRCKSYENNPAGIWSLTID